MKGANTLYTQAHLQFGTLQKVKFTGYEKGYTSNPTKQHFLSSSDIFFKVIKQALQRGWFQVGFEVFFRILTVIV